MEHSIENKIDVVIANTEIIKRQTAKVKEENQVLKEQLGLEEAKTEEKKEKLREAQKSFKKIGCNIKEEVADKFEDLAHRLNYPNTSAMCRTYLMLLLENEEYQKTFVEFSTVLKSESGEA
jgi:cell pole-organizing protein PopZ